MGFGTKYAVKSVSLYRSDVVVRWADKRRVDGEFGGVGATRGNVCEFSEASRKRLAFVASNTPVEFTVMITLTYPREFSSEGKAVKKNLNRILAWLRSKGMRDYLWFLEFQKRGAPHYHILTNVRVEKGALAEAWYRAVGSGDERHLAAGTRVERVRNVDGARRYAVKYSMKMRQKNVPEGYRDVGRFWGNSKSVEPKPFAEYNEAMRQDELVGLLDGWKYRGKLRRGPLSTLYNASDILVKNMVQ